MHLRDLRRMLLYLIIHIGVLYGDQLGKHHEMLWGDQVEVTEIVTLRDKSGLVWCGGVKMVIVAGLERYLGGNSPYNLVMFQVWEREKKA